MLSPAQLAHHLLFFWQYALIAWTGLFLVSPVFVAPASLPDVETGIKHNMAALILGFVMLGLLAAYLVGLIGNHYVKVYAVLSNMLYLAVTLVGFLFLKFFSSSEATGMEILWSFCLPQVLLLYWLPSLASMYVLLAVPSMSTIIPDKLYLGNAAAGRNLDILDDKKITHVLRLQSGLGKEDAKNEINSGVASRKVLCLECTDELGSQNSLANVSSQAVQFIDEALKTGSNSEEPNRVLVHCTAGCSRSPAMTVYWLVQSGSVKSVPEGVKLIRSARPIVDISSDHTAWLLQDSEPAKKTS
jgi:hypothetical protein